MCLKMLLHPSASKIATLLDRGSGIWGLAFHPLKSSPGPAGCWLCWLKMLLWALVLDPCLSHTDVTEWIPGRKQPKKGLVCFGSWVQGMQFTKTGKAVTMGARGGCRQAPTARKCRDADWCSPTRFPLPSLLDSVRGVSPWMMLPTLRGVLN